MRCKTFVLVVVTAVVALLGASCGGSSGEDAFEPGATSQAASVSEATEVVPEASEGSEAVDESPEPVEDLEPTDEPAVDEPAEAPRLVVLGEDFVLADVLALGGQPVAATATLDDEFSGIERDTSMITPLSSTEANLELLASLEPDQILTTSFVVDQIDLDVLEAIAPTTVIGAEGDWRSQVREIAIALGNEDAGETLLARYETAVADAQQFLSADLVVTIATVYPGPSLAVWTDGPTNIPQTVLDLGATLSPGAGAYPDERNGRSFLSNELIGDLRAPVLILSQSSAVEGEDDAVAELTNDSLWATLPAVIDGAVITVDRLGYPGVEGRIRLIEDLVAGLS